MKTLMLCGLLAMVACAPVPQGGLDDRLAGRSLTIQDGAFVSVLSFGVDGGMTALFRQPGEDDIMETGTWYIDEAGALCVVPGPGSVVGRPGVADCLAFTLDGDDFQVTAMDGTTGTFGTLSG